MPPKLRQSASRSPNQSPPGNNDYNTGLKFAPNKKGWATYVTASSVPKQGAHGVPTADHDAASPISGGQVSTCNIILLHLHPPHHIHFHPHAPPLYPPSPQFRAAPTTAPLPTLCPAASLSASSLKPPRPRSSSETPACRWYREAHRLASSTEASSHQSSHVHRCIGRYLLACMETWGGLIAPLLMPTTCKTQTTTSLSLNNS